MKKETLKKFEYSLLNIPLCVCARVYENNTCLLNIPLCVCVCVCN